MVMADILADSGDGNPTEMVTTDAICEDIARLDLELRIHRQGDQSDLQMCDLFGLVYEPRRGKCEVLPPEVEVDG